MKLNLFERILLGVIAVLLSVTLLLSLVRKSDVLTEADNKIYSIYSVIKYALLQRPYETLIGWTEDYTSYYALRKENDLLRKELDSLNQYKSELMETKRQVTELSDLLNLKNSLTDYELMNATVTGRDLSSWSNVIQIDVGSADGIDENYAVMTPKGLIGRIYTTYEHSSIVKLITAEDGLNKVSVLIQINAETTAQAYLETYDANRNAFVIKLLSTGQSVAPGMAVMTSGMGGVFPAGLLVGSVVEVSELDNAVGMNVYVTPAADFDHFNYVSVVKMAGLH